MSRRPVTAVLLSAALLSACGTGLQAQSYKARTPFDSTSTSVGTIAIRNLAVAAPTEGETLPAGGTAIVTGTFINEGTEPDALINASTDSAGGVLLQSGADAASVPIPASGTSGSGWSLVLDGLAKELRPGQFISLTLVFEKAGRTTLQVPIRAGNNGLGEREHAQDPYGGHGG